ncbi:MAG: hypothetical protein U1F23_06795 [Lysobacterales bacterium]
MVWAFKAGNLLLHHCWAASPAFALFRTFATVGALTGRDLARFSAWWAWFAASVWLLHPLLATVLYVVQRMAMLSALFTLLAMLAYVHGRIAVEAQQRRRSFLLLLVAVPVCTILAALSKENGVLAPGALCAVIELFAFPPAPGKRRATPAKIFIGLALFAPAIVAIVLTGQVTLVYLGLCEPAVHADRAAADRSARAVGLHPDGDRAGWNAAGVYHDDYPLSRGLLDPPTTLIALVAWPAAWIAWRLRQAIPAARPPGSASSLSGRRWNRRCSRC